MCNEYRYTKPLDRIRDEFSQLKIPLRFTNDAAPNFPPRDDIRIGERAPIIRRAGDGVELALAPWAWKAASGKPVFNYVSDGRRFADSDRVLIPADGFYEFTTPSEAKAKRKHRHLFTMEGADLFWIAGIVKAGAFAMLTTEPGPDISPYHGRQIVVLPPSAGMDWLDLTQPEAEILQALPAGSLRHEQLS